MSKYGQYCPIAQALDLIGDRWTLLIIRDMLTGACHFNDLERGLPGLSRGLLSRRLQQLEQAGVIEKQMHSGSRQSTAYHLTAAGQALQDVVQALLVWGTTWAFGDPSPEQLDPLLLLWWMRSRVRQDQLPAARVVVQFDFHGAAAGHYWLILTPEDVTICLTHPGYEVDVQVTTDIAVFFKLWLGQLDYEEARSEHGMIVAGIPRLADDFPHWFAWSLAAPAVRAARAARQPSR